MANVSYRVGVSSANFPGLLSGYPVRPAWQVAGVDYYVGYPPATIFKHPLTDTLPSGVTRDSTGHFFTVTGNNVTIDAWDFSENGGWQVEVTGNDCIIQNCRFIIGANNLQPINALLGGFVTVQDCTLDGGSGSATALRSGAGLLVQRCRFTGFRDDCINAVVAGNFTVINNLFDTIGAAGFHSDIFQTFNNVDITSIRLSLNTLYQPASHVTDGINSFIRTGDMGAHLVKDLESAQNTLIFLDTGGSANVWQLATAQTGTESTRNFLVRDNYVNPSQVTLAILTAFYQVLPDASNPMSWRNINLNNGNTLLWGPFNNQSSGVPSNPPSAPVISTASKVGSTAQLTGTALASSVVDILNPDETGRWPLALYGTATSNGAGAWTFTSGTLTAGLHNFVARVSDSNMNTSDASTTSAVTI